MKILNRKYTSGEVVIIVGVLFILINITFFVNSSWSNSKNLKNVEKKATQGKALICNSVYIDSYKIVKDHSIVDLSTNKVYYLNVCR